MPTLKFVGLDEGERSLQVPTGETLYDLCLEHDIEMIAACGGFAACNTCRVRVISGQLSPLDEIEVPFLDRPDQRLGCQATVLGDVVLELDPGEA